MRFKVTCVFHPHQEDLYLVYINDSIAEFNELNEAYSYGFETLQKLGVIYLQDEVLYADYFYDNLQIFSYDAWNLQVKAMLDADILVQASHAKL